jgi:rhodanese-related sulfurtransferase
MTLTVATLKDLLGQGDFPVIDIRLIRAFAAEHILGTLSVPFQQDGFVVAVKQRTSGDTIVLFGDQPRTVAAAKALWEQSGGTVMATWDQGLDPWKAAGESTICVKNVTVDELAAEPEDSRSVIDVREPYEWRSGVIPGALRIPLSHLRDEMAQLSPDRSYVVVCAHGNRSLAGAAQLADHGYHTASVLGGMALWLGAGYPVDRTSD